jgi:transcriptional regulator with XRE-family HTH domain
MNIGDKLRSLREYYGYTQSDLGRHLNIAPRNISNYETVSEPTGVLDYITDFCAFFKIPVAEFFMEDVEDLKRELPDYITPSDAAILKILNTSVDVKTRNEVKSAFVHIMKAVLVRYEDRLKHMPEYQKLFEGDTFNKLVKTDYEQIEEILPSSIHDENLNNKK